MEQFLETLGLTENEQRVYTMLLHEGASLAGKITQKTGIHRRNVYDCLERLIQKGLVGYIKENNRKTYSVTDPSLLQERLAEQEKGLAREMPRLLALYTQQAERKETVFFRGTSGIKLVLRDQLQVGKEILVLATGVDVSEVARHFFPQYQRERVEKKIATRMLFDSAHKNKAEKLDVPLCEMRFVKDVNQTAMAQYVYGDTVALVVYGSDPIAILIRQREIASAFRANFEVLWNLGGKTR